MKQKTGRKLLSFLLALAMLVGLMPGMSLTAYAAPTEKLLTTITATAKEQASYSTANVATVSFSYTAGGSSAYLANWGWWGYGWTATVTPADGYTITKCIFYDDANRTATDSEAPFVVETTEEDKTPRINGTPIDGGNYQSKGIKKIEVYGYASKAAQTITASDVTATYGDTDKSVSASVTTPTTGGGAISYAVKTGSENYIDVNASTGALTIKAVPPTDGKAYVIVTAAETDDYAETTKEVTVTISPATPVITLADSNFTYNGDPKQIIQSVTYPGGTDLYLRVDCLTSYKNKIYWAKYTGSSDLTNVFAPTNAGTYSVYYFVGTPDNPEGGTRVDGQTRIDKALPKSDNFTFTAPSSLNYDGTAKTATVTIKDGVIGMGEVTVRYYSDEDRYNEVAECKNPGTYYVGIDVDNGENYNSDERVYDWYDDSWKFTIASPHTHSFTYTADGATVTATCGAEGCDLTSNPTLTIVAPTLTTYGQTGEGISEKATLDGLDAFNSATDLTVAASDIKYYGVEEYEIEGHTYKKQGDELAQVPTAAGEYVAGLTLSNVKTSETETGDVIARVWYTIAPASISSVTVTDITAPVATEALDTEAATSTANVTLGAVTWNPTTTPAAYATQYTATVIATAAANYAFADTVTATVNGQAATVTKNDGGTLTIAYTFEKTALTPVTITATDKKADWSADGIAIPVEGMFTITEGAGAATYTVTNGTGEGTYDAQTGKLTVTKCGTFTVKVSTAATDTYAAGAETTATLTVNKVDSTAATVTANTLTYTGSAQALVTVTGEATGGTMQYALGTKDAATEEYTPSIPTGTDAGTYYVWYKVVGDDNHLDLQPTCITVEISRKDVTVTAADQTAVLNGTIKTGVNKAELNDAIEGHVLAGVTLVSSDTAAFTENGTITPSEAVIKDADGNDVTENYNITYSDGTLQIFTMTGKCGENAVFTLDARTGHMSISGTGTMEDYQYSSRAPWARYRDLIKDVFVVSGITRIGNNAFDACKNLTEVTGCLGIETIGTNAFRNCKALTKVAACTKATEVEPYAFSGCQKLETLGVNAGIVSLPACTRIGGYAFYGCSSIKKVNTYSPLTYIGVKAFKNCTSITKVQIGANCTTICSYAFFGNTALAEVTGCAGVERIWDYAFCNNTKLVSVGGCTKVTNIEKGAFRNCSSLTKVGFKADCIRFSSVKIVGETAFMGCKAAKCIDFGSALNELGDSALRNAISLEELYIRSAKLVTVEANVLKGINSSAVIYVPGAKVKSYTDGVLKGKGQSDKVAIKAI